MTTVPTFIETIVLALPPVDGENFMFVHEDRNGQNLPDDQEFPVVMLDFPIVSNDLLPKSGAIVSGYPLGLYFGMKSELDWTTPQHEDVIAQMLISTRKFIAAVQREKQVREIKNVKRTHVKCFLDLCTSGVFLEMEVVFADGSSICI